METEIQPPAKQRKTGLVHVLTGDGNGKTTSAIGIVVRASGRGMKAAFVQFLKNGLSSELAPMQRMGVEVVSGAKYSEKDLSAGQPQETVFMAYKSSLKADEGDRQLARASFAKATGFARSGKYDLVVLDGIFGAVRAGLVTEADVLNFLREKAPNCELVLTGRGASPAIEAAADYVTHVEKIKHPFDMGMTSRCGIDY